MKKILFITLIFSIILTMSCKEDEDDPGKKGEPAVEKPKIYKVTYDGNGYTGGNLPVDNNLYAEGDTFELVGCKSPGVELEIDGIYASGWVVEGASTVIPNNGGFGDGKYYYTDITSTVTFGKNDILIILMRSVLDISSLLPRD